MESDARSTDGHGPDPTGHVTWTRRAKSPCPRRPRECPGEKRWKEMVRGCWRPTATRTGGKEDDGDGRRNSSSNCRCMSSRLSPLPFSAPFWLMASRISPRISPAPCERREAKQRSAKGQKYLFALAGWAAVQPILANAVEMCVRHRRRRCRRLRRRTGSACWGPTELLSFFS